MLLPSQILGHELLEAVGLAPPPATVLPVHASIAAVGLFVSPVFLRSRERLLTWSLCQVNQLRLRPSKNLRSEPAEEGLAPAPGAVPPV